MDTDKIRRFEKEYFDKIIYLFNNPQSKFKKHLLDLEALTRKNYAHYNKVWGKKNKIDIAVERILRYHLYRDKTLNIVDVYTSPLSTDIAIELKDVILCIDAKTVDLYGNLGDEKSLAIQKNQITFDNKPESGRSSDSGIKWPGILFPPHLEPFYIDKNNKKKPCLTYFINFYYEDDGSSFKLSHMCFCSVPHGQIVKEPPFNKTNLAHGFKTWDYIEDDSFGKQYQPVEEGSPDYYQKKLNWHKKTGLSKGKNVIKSYVDTSLFSPINSSHYCLWKKPNKPKGEKKAIIWKVSLWGGSARIYKEKLLDRVDHENRPWEGVKEFRIGKGHTSNYLTTNAFWGITEKKPEGNSKKTISRQKEIDNMAELQGDTS